MKTKPTLYRRNLSVTNFTPLEDQIKQMMIDGKKPNEIAQELSIKSTTVQRRIYTIREKERACG